MCIYCGESIEHNECTTIEEAHKKMIKHDQECEDNPLVKKLNKIKNWCEAYPIDIFIEPDLKKAHKVLKKYNITLDSISAHVSRRILSGVKEIIER